MTSAVRGLEVAKLAVTCIGAVSRLSIAKLAQSGQHRKNHIITFVAVAISVAQERNSRRAGVNSISCRAACPHAAAFAKT